MKVLIFGGNGFVGAKLAEHLKEKFEVTIVSRKKLDPLEKIQSIQADLDRPATLDFVKNYDVIFYLVHSMNEQGDFEELEKRQAQNLAQLLSQGQKVIYLSGLAQGEDLSKHMRSRIEVGRILASSKAICLEFRASIVIGDKSLSFEMIRAVVERFPVILEANWSKSLCSPIFIDDLVLYLEKSLEYNESEIIEVGGAEVVEYVELLKIYARMIDVKRPILKLPHFPQKVIFPIMDVFLPECSEVGKNLFDSITIDSTVQTTNYQKFKISTRTIEFAMRKCVEENQKTWDEVSVEDLFNHDKFQDIKKHLAPAHLVDHYEFYIPFPKIYIKKALDSFLKLYNINPFKKFSLIEFSNDEDHYVLKMKRKLIAEFESNISFAEINGVTKIEFVHHYHPTGFMDGASYVAFQKFSHLVCDTIRKFLPK